jgi:hypothetical protein
MALIDKPILRHLVRIPSGKVEPSAWRQIIERQSVTTGIAEVAAYIQENLGQRVTAYLSGINDAKLVGQWASGKVKPRSLPDHRLRSGYQAARYLVEGYGPKTARAWFFGTNSLLDSQAPAYVLRQGESPEDWDDVVSAAKAFVEDLPLGEGGGSQFRRPS